MHSGIVIGALIAAGIWYIWWINKKENYGAMKNIKHIPFNDCVSVCENHYNHCYNTYKDTDLLWCDEKFNACTEECYYTPYHRLQG